MSSTEERWSRLMKERLAVHQKAQTKFQDAYKRWEADKTTENDAAMSEAYKETVETFDALIRVNEDSLIED